MKEVDKTLAAGAFVFLGTWGCGLLLSAGVSIATIYALVKFAQSL